MSPHLIVFLSKIPRHSLWDESATAVYGLSKSSYMSGYEKKLSMNSLFPNVGYLFKARTVEPEEQPLLGNGCVTHNNGVTVGSGVSCAVYDKDQLLLQDSLETAVRRVGGWCEMAPSLQGREPGSRGSSTLGKRYQEEQWRP
jgi:hypothetical protein